MKKNIVLARCEITFLFFPEAFECIAKFWNAEWFQQVIHSAELYGLQCILVISCGKDDFKIYCLQLLQHFKTGGAGEFNIKKNQIGMKLCDCFHSFLSRFA